MCPYIGNLSSENWSIGNTIPWCGLHVSPTTNHPNVSHSFTCIYTTQIFGILLWKEKHFVGYHIRRRNVDKLDIHLVKKGESEMLRRCYSWVLKLAGVCQLGSHFLRNFCFLYFVGWISYVHCISKMILLQPRKLDPGKQFYQALFKCQNYGNENQNGRYYLFTANITNNIVRFRFHNFGAYLLGHVGLLVPPQFSVLAWGWVARFCGLNT
jgi:hypothetical protein